MADIAIVEPQSIVTIMPPKAAEAFAAYYEMGPSRSLRKLAAREGKGRSRVVQLERWSKGYDWQQLLKDIAAEKIERANEYRFGTYEAITSEYYRRIVENEPMRNVMKLEALNSVYDRVKPTEVAAAPTPTGPITVRLEIVPPRLAE